MSLSPVADDDREEAHQLQEKNAKALRLVIEQPEHEAAEAVAEAN